LRTLPRSWRLAAPLACGAIAIAVLRAGRMGEALEGVAVVTGAAGVWLMARENAWGWPLGMVSCAALGVVFLDARLYGDMALQAVYVALDAAGWWWWTRARPPDAPLRVSRACRSVVLGVAAAVAAVTPAMTLLLRRVGDAAPFWDALTTALSLAGQLLLTRKHLESWYAYALANVLYVGLYVARGLHATALLYAFFLAMTATGLVRWRRTLQPAPAPALP
jgi:nicotinamide mononucleotide transporter